MKLPARLCLFSMISIAVLGVAVAWGSQHCEPQFPKIVGWAIGTYESLTSGIIAGAATLIVGWLAWTAI